MEYSEEKAKENSKQFMQQLSFKSAFFDTNIGRESVMCLEKRLEASKRVGIVKFDGSSIFGTCFRVGENKVMTALHVIQVYLNASKLCKS